MNTLRKIVMITAALALGACTNALDGPGAGDGLSGDSVDLTAADTVVPGSAADPTSLAYFQQTVGDRVLFEVDQATLTAAGRATLNAQAAWLQQNAGYSVIIEGHADEQGTREYNLALGARRANSAREYLMSQGVPAGRLKTVSYGKERPIEVCSEENCYSKNRRAVTVLAGALTG